MVVNRDARVYAKRQVEIAEQNDLVDDDFVDPHDLAILKEIAGNVYPKCDDDFWNKLDGRKDFTNVGAGVAFGSYGHIVALSVSPRSSENMTTLLAKIAQFANLKMLTIHNCQELTMMPVDIGNLVNIETLEFEKCLELTKLPTGIEKLVGVKRLDLSDCPKLSVRPSEIRRLVNLKELSVEDGSIQSLPQEIGSLVNLIKLEVYCKKLESLPDEIGELVNLQGLFLRNCHNLSSLPAEMGNLKVNLIKLDLTFCEKLESLPDEIGELVNLQELDLSGCSQLTSLPAEMGKLKDNLITLDLTFCSKLESLPDEIGELVNLQELVLSNCRQLSELPGAVGNLVNLNRLDLSSCYKLAKLPAEIGELKRLQCLYLSDCSDLSTFPAEIGALSANLDDFDFDGCTKLKYPDLSMREQPQMTITFFSKLFEMKQRPLDIINMLKGNGTDEIALAALRVFCTYAEFAEPLYRAVKHSPHLADWTIPETESTLHALSEASCKESREAMCKALLFLGRFKIDKRDALHISATSVVLKADEYSSEGGLPNRVALKLMHRRDQFLRELKGRDYLHSLDSSHVVGINQAFYDENDDVRGLEYDGRIPIEGIPKLSEDLTTLLSTFDRSRRGSTGDESDPPLKYLLVMDLGDRSLQDALTHDRLNKNLLLSRHITQSIAIALQHLHEQDRIHADVKPLNVLRTGTSWKLIDFDVSCGIGNQFGTKLPSTAYCPPEMARVIRTAGDDMEKLSKYEAQETYDLWSLGAVLFRLLSGEPLWRTRDDDSISSRELDQLAEWSKRRKASRMKTLLRDCTEDQKVGLDLISKLLEPGAKERMEHFPNGMTDVLDHPFFRGERLDAATLEDLREGQKRIESSLIEQSQVLTNLSLELKLEMRYSREVLLLGMFEATEVMTPTSFVILREELPSEEPTENLLLSVSKELLKADGSGFDANAAADAVLSEDAKKLKERVEDGITWAKRLQTIVSGALEGDSSTIFETLKESLGDLVVGNEMYFYLVDELTGKPVCGEGYPIKITTPSELIPKLLPLMQVTMRAASLVNGVAGIARMFGYPLPMIPETLRSQANECVEVLKQESSVEKFGSLNENVRHLTSDSPDKEVRDTVRGASLRELLRFFDEHDKEKAFSGLRRISDAEGYAIWTALEGEAVSEALETRYDERCAERAKKLHAKPKSNASLVRHSKQTVSLNEGKVRSSERRQSLQDGEFEA